jgi:hypothetical protein
MANRAEIYALCDPDTDQVRYIGKANDSAKRLKGHLVETRRKSPLYDWIGSLRAQGKIPTLQVLMVAWDWQAAEKLVITQYRENGRLLNLADGGDEPKCSKATRAANGRANSAKVHSDPVRRHIWEIKKNLGLALRQGYLSEEVKAKMRLAANLRPDMFGKWANI